MAVYGHIAPPLDYYEGTHSFTFNKNVCPAVQSRDREVAGASHNLAGFTRSLRNRETMKSAPCSSVHPWRGGVTDSQLLTDGPFEGLVSIFSQLLTLAALTAEVARVVTR